MTDLIPIWIDTDTGVDDAVALLCALKLDKLAIRGISAVAGNVEHAKTFRNCRNVLAYAGREDIKVYPGAVKPMCVELDDASEVHGKDGLGGVVIPDSPAEKETMHAWDAIYEAAKKEGGKLQIVAVGPLTNIANAIISHPDLKDMIERILIMGGAAVGGNATMAAEFNIYADPHSAETVMQSGIPVVMFGLDVTVDAYLDSKDIQDIRDFNTKISKFFVDVVQSNLNFYIKNYKREILCIHDACPLIYLQYPEIFTGQKAGVYVETQSRLCFGKTVTDIWSDTKFKTRETMVMLGVDREKFASTLKGLLQQY
ncbi:nucleoside hydrolase [Solobacterium sp.]|uniref:nucleoside hydrolase n=1 Tax=Solobacterium sp. TaxID=2060878 RepID=UPI001CABA1A4|nr:nucleoside hydrolase [Solobacterium sp.]MBF1096344.1 nucleoside hydrolase [Solobacterium sp.]MBF1098756.1 nucleoside hydrolase [Solobacterium sp.]